MQGDEGEDLVEKQNAEIGLMPVVSNEETEYGYTAENRHMVQSFLDGKRPGGKFQRRPQCDRTPDDGVYECGTGANTGISPSGPGYLHSRCCQRRVESAPKIGLRYI